MSTTYQVNVKKNEKLMKAKNQQNPTIWSIDLLDLWNYAKLMNPSLCHENTLIINHKKFTTSEL